MNCNLYHSRNPHSASNFGSNRFWLKVAYNFSSKLEVKREHGVRGELSTHRPAHRSSFHASLIADEEFVPRIVHWENAAGTRLFVPFLNALQTHVETIITHKRQRQVKANFTVLLFQLARELRDQTVSPRQATSTLNGFGSCNLKVFTEARDFLFTWHNLRIFEGSPGRDCKTLVILQDHPQISVIQSSLLSPHNFISMILVLAGRSVRSKSSFMTFHLHGSTRDP